METPLDAQSGQPIWRIPSTDHRTDGYTFKVYSAAVVSALQHHLQHKQAHGRQFFWYRIRWHAVAAYLPTDRPFEILDVGAGTGILGEFLARDRPLATYRFVEPITDLEAHLEYRYGAAANARDRVGIERADFVTLLDVLEHQEDDATFLSDLVAAMKPGAVLLLTVPALQRLWSSWDVALGHYRRYDKRMIRALLNGLPVSVFELNYLFPEMLLPALVRRRTQPSGKANAPKAEFPELSPLANRVLYGIGRVTVELRRFAPAGTSVVLALARR
jgi:SAM-dependent methyltransferase